MTPTLMGKWLQLLQEVAPRVTRVAVIFNPDTALFAPLFNRAIEAAAPSIGITVTLAPVHDDPGIEEAIAAPAREPGGGVVSLPDPFTVAHRDVVIAAAFRHSLPLIGTLQYQCRWPDCLLVRRNRAVRAGGTPDRVVVRGAGNGRNGGNMDAAKLDALVYIRRGITRLD